MNWLKVLYRKYKKGAEANRFPISIHGIFGRRSTIPRNLNATIPALESFLSKEDKEFFYKLSEKKFIAITHHTFGRWIRNKWNLWDEKSKLHKWFKRLGIFHPDDMSGIILTTFYRHEHGLPIKQKDQIKHYLEYWRLERLKEGVHDA